MPPVKETRLVANRKRAFLAVAFLLWNSLPIEASLALSLLSFRRQVKIELFRQVFNIVYCYVAV